MSDDTFRKECEDRGRALIMCGEWTTSSLVDWFDIERYWESERDNVEIRGQCSHCAESELAEIGGKIVCRHTNRKCTRLTINRD